MDHLFGRHPWGGRHGVDGRHQRLRDHELVVNGLNHWHEAVATTSALALAVVCGVIGPSTSDTKGWGRHKGRRGWSATDKEVAVTSQVAAVSQK